MYIYTITNNLTGWPYVGQTIQERPKDRCIAEVLRGKRNNVYGFTFKRIGE
jgi:hypothetical protein